MKKLLTPNFQISSNGKNSPILHFWDLTKNERYTLADVDNKTEFDAIDEDTLEGLECNYYFRVYGIVYGMGDFQDASCQVFEDYINTIMSDCILEDRLITYITCGMYVIGAIVISFYENETFKTYSFKNL